MARPKSERHNIKTLKIWKDLSYDARCFFDRMKQEQEGGVFRIFGPDDIKIVHFLQFVDLLASVRFVGVPGHRWSSAEIFESAYLIAQEAYRKAQLVDWRSV